MTAEKCVIRVLLIDAEVMLLDGLEAILRREQDVELVGRCTTAVEAAALCRRQRPDVIVFDLPSGAADPFGMLSELRQSAPVAAHVLLTSAVSERQMIDAMQHGVAGVLLKDMPARLLVECIRKVFAGEQWIEKKVAGRVLQRAIEETRGDGALSPREREIVSLVGRGLRNKEIATNLAISAATVKVHLSNIFAKMNVTNRTELALRARR